jgi:hypothetical protein
MLIAEDPEHEMEEQTREEGAAVAPEAEAGADEPFHRGGYLLRAVTDSKDLPASIVDPVDRSVPRVRTARTVVQAGMVDKQLLVHGRGDDMPPPGAKCFGASLLSPHLDMLAVAKVGNDGGRVGGCDASAPTRVGGGQQRGDHGGHVAREGAHAAHARLHGYAS